MAMQGGAWSALDNANGALLLAFVFTYCAADAFLATFDSAVEAIYLCYLVDQVPTSTDLP